MMVEFFRSRTAWAAIALALATMAPASSRAADLLAAPPLEAVDEERVTFGTGWYLRGDIAASNDVKINVGGATLPTGNGFFNSWSGGAGFGYKYNDWLRTDITVDYRNRRSFSGNTIGPILCQSGAAPVTVGGVIVGSTPTYGGCYDYTRARIDTVHALFNAYVDLGTWWGVTPYVGAGLGFSTMYQKASQNWFFRNGVAYNPTWTDPFTGGTYSAYWDQTRSNNTLQFAWATMAGVSYAFSRHVSVDVGYRFVQLGKMTNYSTFTGTTTQNVRAQDVRVGFRYTPD